MTPVEIINKELKELVAIQEYCKTNKKQKSQIVTMKIAWLQAAKEYLLNDGVNQLHQGRVTPTEVLIYRYSDITGVQPYKLIEDIKNENLSGYINKMVRKIFISAEDHKEFMFSRYRRYGV